ncbi:hypothetical protein LTR49_028553 [Elasticomyces elasticus]|nr:hypothetical protein LTR49_028553 [Elasticomyces elasticus]
MLIYLQFIEVLKEDHSILKEKYVARLPKSYKKRPEKLELDKAAVLDNMDEYLELEDPKAPTKTASPPRVARSVPRRAAPRQGGEQSLLQDLEQTDKVTGTASMLMQKANVSLTAQYPDFRDMDGVDEFLGFTLVTTSL